VNVEKTREALSAKEDNFFDLTADGKAEEDSDDELLGDGKAEEDSDDELLGDDALDAT
jgi:hypothetical protein